MAISYVGVSTAWTSTASSTSFTINKPAGTLQDGDFMIAVLSWTTGSSTTDLTVTAPAGWTKQDEAYNGGDGFDHQIAVMTRTYATGDPSSWSGTLSGSSAKVKVSGTVAYRGVQNILAKGTSSAAYPTTSYSTATVNNTQSGSWRFVAAGYESGSLTYSMNTNEVQSRLLAGDTNSGSGDNVQLRIADSNGAISTGNTSRTVSRSAVFDASCSWIGILREATGTPATGAFAVTPSMLTVAAGGEVVNNGTMAATLSAPTVAADGYGQPPVVTGTSDVTLSPAEVSLAGVTDVRGSLDAMVLPLVSFNGETRVVGVRVINVDAEDRVIRVDSRAVAD
jgi:hypothetical protein